MIFGLGPVVRYELITTARRGRFYIARVVYGLSLLFMLWIQFGEFDARHPAGGTAEEVRTFAEATFVQFAGAQGVAILCLIPALVAGVIADEHQRKTLHYLLASRLSSTEIVLGKLSARMVHVGTFVALGIPVVCLLALYGGLNPENVYYVYLGTLTMVIFSSGLSILVSIMARRPRDAILAAFGLEALWLLVPLWIAPIQGHLDGGSLGWVAPVNEWALATNPVFVWWHATNQTYVFALGGMRPVWFVGPFTGAFNWMVGLLSGIGLIMVSLAVLGLRPMRGSSWPGAQPQTGWWSRLIARVRAITHARAATALTRNRLLISPPTRSPCGDDPMIWKERHTSIGGGLRWLGSRPVVLFFSVLIGCYLLDVASPLVVNVFGGVGRAESRMVVCDALRGASMALAVLGMLGIAASAAVSLTGEREQDTWISLATTLLTPSEVIRAKQFGAVWSARRVGLAILVMWATGLLLLAIHPLGVLAAALYVAVIAWLIATIGLFASAFAKNSTRALVTTFVTILIFTAISQWPWVVWELLIPYQRMGEDMSRSPLPVDGSMAAVYLMIRLGPLLVVQGLVAVLLTLLSCRRLRATWGL